jgi:predicted nucleotidyltransferase
MTGRQVHRVTPGGHSLWSVQQALRALAALGLVHTTHAGQAILHSVNEAHFAVTPLRVLADPVAALRTVVNEFPGLTTYQVLLFGSLARGEAHADSDVDLAIIGPGPWDDAPGLQAAVTARLGNRCDVLAFTNAEFTALSAQGEPVVQQILHDAIPLHSPSTPPE